MTWNVLTEQVKWNKKSVFVICHLKLITWAKHLNFHYGTDLSSVHIYHHMIYNNWQICEIDIYSNNLSPSLSLWERPMQFSEMYTSKLWFLCFLNFIHKIWLHLLNPLASFNISSPSAQNHDVIIKNPSFHHTDIDVKSMHCDFSMQ